MSWSRLVRTGLAIIVLFGSVVLGAGAWSAEPSLRIGVQNERPPFSFSNLDGGLEGFDVEIAKALCAVLDTRCELVSLDFTALIPSLQQGGTDAAVASISITDKRRELVDFTAPYYRAATRYVARADTIPDTSVAGLVGKVVGVKRGTTHDGYLSSMLGDIVSIRRYGHADEIFLDLALGRLDLAIGDDISLIESFLDTELGLGFAFVEPPLEDPAWFGYGEGIAVRKGNSELLGRLDAALATILANGAYDRVRLRYFDYDIYGDREVATIDEDTP